MWILDAMLSDVGLYREIRGGKWECIYFRDEVEFTWVRVYCFCGLGEVFCREETSGITGFLTKLRSKLFTYHKKKADLAWKDNCEEMFP